MLSHKPGSTSCRPGYLRPAAAGGSLVIQSNASPQTHPSKATDPTVITQKGGAATFGRIDTEASMMHQRKVSRIAQVSLGVYHILRRGFFAYSTVRAASALATFTLRNPLRL